MYRGAFGSHLANVFRRLSRVCRYYPSAPQSSCQSLPPLQTRWNWRKRSAGSLLFPLKRMVRDPSQKEYVLIQPPAVTGKDSELLWQGIHCECDSRTASEADGKRRKLHCLCKVQKKCGNYFKRSQGSSRAGAGFLGTAKPEQISGYRGGYTPVERRTIEKNMLSGKLSGLVATNALELGIDIGKLALQAALAGYPGTRGILLAAGRPGRKKQKRWERLPDSGQSSHGRVYCYESRPGCLGEAVKMPLWIRTNPAH